MYEQAEVARQVGPGDLHQAEQIHPVVDRIPDPDDKDTMASTSANATIAHHGGTQGERRAGDRPVARNQRQAA